MTTIPPELQSLVFRALEDIYKELDDELLPYQSLCQQLSRCCHFKEYGHRLYSLSLEVEYLKQQLPLPDKALAPLTCPYLQKNGACGNRLGRPLGCRIFFCAPEYQGRSQEIYEKYHKKIETLLHQYQLPYVYQEMTSQLSTLSESISHD